MRWLIGSHGGREPPTEIDQLIDELSRCDMPKNALKLTLPARRSMLAFI